MTGDGSQDPCCKEILHRNLEVRFMNQGKLEVVKQEMARVNIGILGISKLKCTGKDSLTQRTIKSTTVGKTPLEERE